MLWRGSVSLLKFYFSIPQITDVKKKKVKIQHIQTSVCNGNYLFHLFTKIYQTNPQSWNISVNL